MATLRSFENWSSNWFAPETVINWEVKGNPKRSHGKSYERFENYFGASTVGEYISAGGTKGDLRHDWAHQFLTLGFESDLPVVGRLAEDPDLVIEKALKSRKKLAKAEIEVAIESQSEEEILS